VAVIDTPVRVPRLALLRAWEWERLGEPHPVLGANHYYMTDEFRADLHRRTHDTLTALGLVSGGVLTPCFRATLAMLARADRAFYSWTTFPHREGDDGAILVAALGRDAVRVLTDDKVVQLDPVSSDGLAGHFLDALPDAEAAAVRPMRVAKSAFDGEEDRTHVNPLADDPRGRDVARLRELMGARRDAVHQMYAAVRDGSGERCRSLPLSVVDLAGRGRFLTYLTGDGGDEIVVVPGDRRHVLDALTATMEGL
jgi:hypothetical protein